MRTQVGIIGAGPAGLVLGHLLHLAGIESVIIERQSREHVQNRVRAGVLEHGTTELLTEIGLGARLQREGLPHHGINLLFACALHHIDFTELTGRHVTVYGQNEVVKDLIDARLAAGLPLFFRAEDAMLHEIEGPDPLIRFRHNGEARALHCDIIAGCDGFHGICRSTIPNGVLQSYEREYPFGWLGILAAAPPASEELVYASHPRGFALLSMRSHSIGRLYLQCAPDEDADRWSDQQIWDELATRLESPGFCLPRGPVLQKGVTAMRSFVVEPMQFGRLYLAGDAAHIVPPTGAKGMNLAISDVVVLARALEAFYRQSREDLLAAYSSTCLRRVWKAQRFSWWMTSMLHRFTNHTPYEARVQQAELDYVTSSPAAATALAENYTGLPLL